MQESEYMKSLNGWKVYDEEAREQLEKMKNVAPGLVFDTAADMEAYISENADTLKTGQNLYIRETGVPDHWWDGTQAVPLEADKTLISADGDEWRLAVEDSGDVVSHKIAGDLEIVAGSLTSATHADGKIALVGIVGTYGAVIIPDASEISIDITANVEVYPHFVDTAGWQYPSFGWWFLRTTDGYIAVHTSNYAETYTVSADLKTWTAFDGGAVTHVPEATLRLVLDNGIATVYADDVVTFSADGISGIGYAVSSVKATTLYGVTVIHRGRDGGSVTADLDKSWKKHIDLILEERVTEVEIELPERFGELFLWVGGCKNGILFATDENGEQLSVDTGYNCYMDDYMHASIFRNFQPLGGKSDYWNGVWAYVKRTGDANYYSLYGHRLRGSVTINDKVGSWSADMGYTCTFKTLNFQFYAPSADTPQYFNIGLQFSVYYK